MAIDKQKTSSQLTIEVEGGANEVGKTVYKKLRFSGLSADCSVDDLYELAEAIKGLLANDTKDFLLTDVFKLVKIN